MLKEKMLKEMMMMMMISLFFIPLLLHLLPTYTTAQPMSSFIYQSCNNDFGNYTAASTYRRNLNNLLTSLAAADNRTSNSGFYNASSGQSPDRVNAVGLCRGDVAPADCRECITDATGRILAGCPNQKEAVVWFDYCMVRYSNRSVYGVLDPNPVTIYMWNVANASDPVQFSAAVGNLLARLRTSASSGEERFATGTAREGNLTIYGLVQCSPDLSGGNCGVCLADAISQISRCCGRRLGGRVINTNCNFRFETYRFYAATTEAPPPGVMPPSSPPPLVSPPPPPPPSIEGNGRRRNPSRIVAIVAPVVAAVAVLGFIFFLLCRRRKVKRSGIATQTEDEISKDDGSLQFDFDTIRAATNGFADESKLGEGGFGAVYKGTLSNGEEIAVKRLAKDSGQGHSEFKNEVKLVAKLQHRNLVRLLGFCLEGRERLLIYEFVPNASLDHFLFNEDRRGQLDWGRRYRIIRGIARGLIYLHVDSRLRIIHRDLKASNILLDADMNPKISDFGMARLFDIDETQGNTSKIVGTYGYMAPEYAMHGLLSMKSDVFSFGVLVLEIISGQMNYGFRHDSSTEDLLSFAWKNWKAGTYSNVVDPSLGNVPSDEIANCVHIGLLCVQDNVDDRPTMASVALMLAGNSVSLQQPSRPAFFTFTAGERGSSWGFDKYLDKDDVSSPSTEAIGLSTNDVSVSELYPR